MEPASSSRSYVLPQLLRTLSELKFPQEACSALLSACIGARSSASFSFHLDSNKADNSSCIIVPFSGIVPRTTSVRGYVMEMEGRQSI